jgi:hypothetical protein
MAVQFLVARSWLKTNSFKCSTNGVQGWMPGTIRAWFSKKKGRARWRPFRSQMLHWSGDGLRLPLPAPAEQTERAEAGGEERESSRERPRGRASARATLHKRYTQAICRPSAKGLSTLLRYP